MKGALIILAAFGTVALAACDKDTAIFATSTSLGINFDSKPPTVAVAFERTEVFIGPRSQNGSAPPAVASIETGGNVFSPHIRQTYATGGAAEIATSSETPKTPETNDVMEGDRKPMIFGTGTTIGFQVGFSPQGAPDSAVLGYRRKEASVIPIAIKPVQENGQTIEKAVYPSVLASIDTTTKMTTVPEVGLATKQFFATGQAAKNLAGTDDIRKAFRAKAAESLTDGAVVLVLDDASKRISTYLRKGDQTQRLDQARVDQLRAWYAPKIGDVRLDEFLYDSKYAGLRLQAIEQFKIPA
jgi:hypothetical protein